MGDEGEAVPSPIGPTAEQAADAGCTVATECSQDSPPAASWEEPDAELRNQLDGISIGSEDELQAASEPADQSVEVFVGGLPTTVTDEELREAFGAVGAVCLGLRVSRHSDSSCKGFGFVRLADKGSAERACGSVVEISGRSVGVHACHLEPPSSSFSPEEDLCLVVAEPDASVNRLLRLIRSHSNKKAAVSAALQAVLSVPSDRCGSEGGESGRTSPSSRDKKKDGSLREDKETEPVPDPATYLNSYPKCKQLINAFRLNSNTHNKTPLAILHEYATRLNLEVVYTETAESNLGPFNVEAKLTSLTGSVLYASATGRGRGKKDAKQVAAAGVIEALLAVVPEADFLQPGKAKQRNSIAYSRAGLGAPGRGFAAPGVHNRGRRPRPPFGGRGDYGGIGMGGLAGLQLDNTFVPATSQTRGQYGSDLDLPGTKRHQGDFGAMHRPGMAGGSNSSYSLDGMSGSGIEPQLQDMPFTMYGPGPPPGASGMAGGFGGGYDGYAAAAAAQQQLNGLQQQGQYGPGAAGAAAAAAGINNAYSALAALQQLVQQQQQQQPQMVPPPPHDVGGQRPPYGYHQQPPPSY